MITPAVLILASSSLILATSNRLSRVLSRVRSLGERMETSLDEASDPHGAKQRMLLSQLDWAVRRAKLLQRAMTAFYCALAAFVLTSVVIGLDARIDVDLSNLLVLLGLVGVTLLLIGSLLLAVESRVALSAVNHETDYIYHLGDRYRPSRHTPDRGDVS